MATFSDSVKANIRLNEGGYVDNADDAGGRTNHGITQDTLDAYCKERQLGHMDVADLTWDEAFAVYEIFFWNRYRAFALNDQNLAENYFDCIINYGPHTAGLLLQEASQMAGDRDGIVGSGTVAWVNSVDASEANSALVDLRKARYNAIVEANPTQEQFLKGWLARASRFLPPDTADTGDA